MALRSFLTNGIDGSYAHPASLSYFPAHTVPLVHLKSLAFEQVSEKGGLPHPPT